MLFAFDDDFVAWRRLLVHVSCDSMRIHIDAEVVLVCWVHTLANVWIPIQCIELVDVYVYSHSAVFRHSNFGRSLGDTRLLFLLLD